VLIQGSLSVTVHWHRASGDVVEECVLIQGSLSVTVPLAQANGDVVEECVLIALRYISLCSGDRFVVSGRTSVSNRSPNQQKNRGATTANLDGFAVAAPRLMFD
jgi:hypothetical protein